MSRKEEALGFAIGTLLGVSLIRIVLALYPWLNPSYANIPVHHAYLGVVGFILFTILLLYFVDNSKLRFAFSILLGISLAAIIDEFNLFLVAGGGEFSYSSSFKYYADTVTVIIGILVLLFSKIHEKKKR